MGQSTNSPQRISFLLVSLMLILYTYYMITNIMSVGNVISSYVTMQAICLLVIEIISIFYLFNHLNEPQTPLCFLFILWVLWAFFDFYVVGLRGEGASNIILTIPSSFIFLYFFYESQRQSIKEKSIVLVFVFIFFLSGFFCISSLLIRRAVYVGEDPFVSNLIFWPLCTVPFLLLIKKTPLKWIMLVLFSILVILTAKRSATICMVLTIVYYVFYTLKTGVKQRKNKGRIIFGLLVISVFSYFFITKVFSSEVGALSERFSSVSEDEGSGRVDIYQHVLNEIDHFSFDEYLFGRGYASIHQTGHTNGHNDALQVFFEYGIIGLLFYILISFHAIKRLFYVRKHLQPYYPGYTVSIIIYVVLGMVSNLYAYNTYFIFICAYWGYVEGIIVMNKKINYVENCSCSNI